MSYVKSTAANKEQGMHEKLIAFKTKKMLIFFLLFKPFFSIYQMLILLLGQKLCLTAAREPIPSMG